MDLIKYIFDKFNTKANHKKLTFDGNFTDEQKKEIVQSALSSASQVLISALVMTNSHEFITGSVVLPDGSKYVLTFNKEHA